MPEWTYHLVRILRGCHGHLNLNPQTMKCEEEKSRQLERVRSIIRLYMFELLRFHISFCKGLLKPSVCMLLRFFRLCFELLFSEVLFLCLGSAGVKA